MRIRILDPQWKKMDPDPGHFFKIYWIFLTKQIVLFFFAYFYAKTWWTIQESGFIYYLSFFNSSNLGFKSNIFFDFS